MYPEAGVRSPRVVKDGNVGVGVDGCYLAKHCQITD